MKIATWNVNSIGVRLPQVLEWLEGNRPDVLCLQEIKCVDAKFPIAAFNEAGYQAEIFGQPTYNGVAILSLSGQKDVVRGLADDDPESQRRLIASTVGKVTIINVYVPNGSEVGSDKYRYKLEWLSRLRSMLDSHFESGNPILLCGDFNIAPEDRDVHDPALWEGKILCSEQEREALGRISDWGFIDVVRKHRTESGLFSWWDYRGGGFRRNHGLRIDHLWATEPLATRSIDAWIDRIPRAMEKPSDHAPVVAEFDI